MKKNNFLALFLVLGLAFASGRAVAQTASVTKDRKYVAVFIMEDILFKGLSAKTPAELATKKIQRVDQCIADPAEIQADAGAEAERKTALLQIRARLVKEKLNLITNK
jgi:hypothetical protein